MYVGKISLEKYLGSNGIYNDIVIEISASTKRFWSITIIYLEHYLKRKEQSHRTVNSNGKAQDVFLSMEN